MGPKHAQTITKKAAETLELTLIVGVHRKGKRIEGRMLENIHGFYYLKKE
jgi:hypothetical protein